MASKNKQPKVNRCVVDAKSKTYYGPFDKNKAHEVLVMLQELAEANETEVDGSVVKDKNAKISKKYAAGNLSTIYTAHSVILPNAAPTGYAPVPAFHKNSNLFNSSRMCTKAEHRKLRIGDVIEAYYLDQEQPVFEVVVEAASAKGEPSVRVINLEGWNSKKRGVSYGSLNTERWKLVGRMSYSTEAEVQPEEVKPSLALYPIVKGSSPVLFDLETHEQMVVTLKVWNALRKAGIVEMDT